MINDIISPVVEQGDIATRYNTFIEQAKVLGEQQANAKQEFIKQQPKYSTIDKIDAALTDNVVGYTTIKDAITNTNETRIGQSIEADPMSMNNGYTREVMPEASQELTKDDLVSKLKQAQIAPEDMVDFADITDSTSLYKAIGRYGNKKDAEKVLESLPLSENLGLTLFASVIDPVSWVAGAGLGKIAKTVDVASKFTGASALALKSLETGGVIGGSVGISEALLQAENRVVEPERLHDAIMFGSALGVGVSLLPSAIVGGASMASQALASNGVQKALTPVQNFVRHHLVFNPIDSIITSPTAPQWMKDMSNKAGLSVFGEKDVTGRFVYKDSEHAIGYKTELEKYLLDARKEQNRAAISGNTSLNEVDAAHSLEYRKFEKLVQDEADVKFAATPMSDRVTIFETETGTTLKSVRGKGQYPDDFYQVITNSFKREFEQTGVGITGAQLKVPKHLQYIHDFYTKFAEEGTRLSTPALANKSSFGFAPRGYDVTAMRSRDRQTVITHFEEMLTANKLTQVELLTAKGAKLTALKDDIKKSAETLYQKAIDGDLKHRFLDSSSQTGGVTKSSFLRKYRLDDSLYPEYFSKSVFDDMTMYHDNMGGKLAVQKFFGIVTDSTGSIGDKLDAIKIKAANEGASVKDTDNLSAIIESVLGTRKIQTNPNSADSIVARVGKKVASAMYSAGFSIYSLAEVGSIIAKNGLVNTITEFIPAHGRMIKLIEGLDKNDPLIGYFNDVGLAGMWLRDTKSMRFETESLSTVAVKGEKFLDDVNHLGRKVSFFSHIQDTLDFMAGGAYLNELMTLSKKVANGGALSSQEASRLGRYGIGESHLKEIASENIKYNSKNGNIVDDYNFYNWNNKDLSKRVMQSLQNSVHDTIVRTDGTKIHRYQSEVSGWIKPLLLQYSQFPTVAYERLVLNMEEQTARTAVGAIAAMGISYTTLDLQDAALVAAGVKDIRMSNEDLAKNAFLKTQFSTIFPSIYDMIATAGGLKTTGGYEGKTGQLPTSAAVSTANRMVSSLSKVPNAIKEDDWEKVVALTGSNVPILNAIPFIKAGFKGLTNQTSIERGSASLSAAPQGDFLSSRIMGNTNDTAISQLLGQHK